MVAFSWNWFEIGVSSLHAKRIVCLTQSIYGESKGSKWLLLQMVVGTGWEPLRFNEQAFASTLLNVVDLSDQGAASFLSFFFVLVA